MTPVGFPHSDIHGSLPAFGFPWLFVDRYVLLRLPVPRHPPCALLSLTFRYIALAVCRLQSCSNHFSFGFSLAISSHLAVQCDDTVFVLLDAVISHSCLASHSYLFLYSVFKVRLRRAFRSVCTTLRFAIARRSFGCLLFALFSFRDYFPCGS